MKRAMMHALFGLEEKNKNTILGLKFCFMGGGGGGSRHK